MAAEKKQSTWETPKVKVSDDKLVRAVLDKVRDRDRELLKRLAR